MVYLCYYNSPVGRLLMSSDGENLTGLWLEKQKYYAATLSEEGEENANLPVFVKTGEWLDKYFRKEKPAISDLPLAPQGGEFRQAVWKILCAIPYGQTMTYGEIARKIAAQSRRKTMSAQAVGGAVGHNPISIIIPCHRVVGSNGSLTGYAGGLDVKNKLLKLESVDTASLRKLTKIEQKMYVGD
ncbi:MAG: methylated-DNA--[protein]-cysteine S-methyltransferase [Alphaproteobacteria bacterium]|nr:methylated-DNA--[protein]-cysteine S-methyltransferase [Alphaproteobacteria bacterium]